jgi:hypothetical protein
MNARHPLSFITADPAVGATCLEDARQADQELHEAMLVEAEDQAPLILLAQLQALKNPSDWFKDMVNARGLRSFDDLLCEAIGEDNATNNAIAELLISAAALPLHKALAEYAGRKYAMDIYEGSEAHH